MSSSSEKTCVNTCGILGFPSKCVCGRDVTIYTSKTQDNPGRPFFRCPTKKDDHLFKWVEEAVYEEVEANLPKLGVIANEMSNHKSEIEGLKACLLELKEDAMKRKKEIRMMLGICIVCICFVVIVLGYVLVVKVHEKKLVLSY